MVDVVRMDVVVRRAPMDSSTEALRRLAGAAHEGLCSRQWAVWHSRLQYLPPGQTARGESGA
jgi:hypothetical protein